MSTKAIHITKLVACEEDDLGYRLTVTADFIAGPDQVYLTVADRTYIVPSEDGRDIAYFILSETRPFDRYALETKLRLVDVLIEKWANQGAGYGSSGECARELRNALKS